MPGRAVGSQELPDPNTYFHPLSGKGHVVERPGDVPADALPGFNVRTQTVEWHVRPSGTTPDTVPIHHPHTGKLMWMRPGYLRGQGDWPHLNPESDLHREAQKWIWQTLRRREFLDSLVPYVVEHLKALIASGKRYQSGQYGRRVSLHMMLAIAEKEVYLLQTTSMSHKQIRKTAIETVHVRPIYLLPRLGRPTISAPFSLRGGKLCMVQLEAGLVFYSRISGRWQRQGDKQFEHVKSGLNLPL